MKNLFFLLMLIIPFSLVAQKKEKKEPSAPKATIYLIEQDSIKHISHVYRGKENKIKVSLEGGIQNIKHKVYVTSKNADIKQDPQIPNQYILIPHKDEWVEIIVDVKTFEDYNFTKKSADGKKKESVTFPPKTYMVGYEKVVVK